MATKDHNELAGAELHPPGNHATQHVGTDSIQNATAAQKGLATPAQITKLDGIASGADATPDASTTTKGKIEIATQAEVNTGTDAVRAVTPDTLSNYTGLGGGGWTAVDATETVKGIAEIATQTEVNAGSDDTRIVTPAKLFGRSATESRAGIIQIADQTEVDTQTDDTKAITPAKLSDFLFNQGYSPTPAATETTAGKAEIATQTEVNAGTDDARIVTPAKLANYSGLGGGGSADLEGLSDVDLTSPAIRQGLFHDGSNFVNQMSPGQYVASVSKTATFTATLAEHAYNVSASGGAVTANLPTAVGCAGKQFVVKKTDSSANAVTLDPNSSETVDGGSTWVLSYQNHSIVVESDGANWQIVAAGPLRALDELPGLVITSPATDDVIKYDGSNFVNGAVPGGGGGGGSGSAFRAYLSTGYVVPSDQAHHKIPFDTESFDSSGDFSTVNNRFTPLVSGIYRFDATLFFSGVTADQTQIIFCVWKNGVSSGTEIQRLNYRSSGTGVQGCAFTAMAQANGSTDYFELSVAFTAGAGTMTSGASQTSFSGAFVRS